MVKKIDFCIYIKEFDSVKLWLRQWLILSYWGYIVSLALLFFFMWLSSTIYWEDSFSNCHGHSKQQIRPWKAGV